MNSFEKKIQNKINLQAANNLADVTEGLCLQVVHKGKIKADLQMGKTYSYYDLASLTKIIFTVPAFMHLVDRKLISVEDKISQYLDWGHFNKITLAQVLSHSAGLPWWLPFYKKLDWRKSDTVKHEQVRQILSRVRSKKTKRAIYSDVDFILLGFVLEAVYQMPLYEVWQSLEWRENLPSLHFNLNNKPKYKRELYAPTEKCPWRKKQLRGEVHDDNTWSFGGVSSHAGLFGRIDDVTRFGLLLRSSYQSKIENDATFATSKTMRKFSRRYTPRDKGDWALGFMLPTRGGASCGQYFHSTSFGHTGFTGTSLWYDPKQDLLVTLLSNRVYPTRENTKFVQLRPLIHDLIVESL